MNFIVLFLIFFQFEKPGRREDFDYPQMAVESVTKALQDAKINIEKIDQACVGYVYGNTSQTNILHLVNKNKKQCKFPNVN